MAKLSDVFQRWHRKALWGLIYFGILIGCGGGGGGGGGAEPPVTPSGPARPGILFGYYGDMDGQVRETADHVDYLWTFGWTRDGTGSRAGRIAEARSQGITKVVLGIEEAYLPDGEARVRATLSELRAQGLLAGVIALYPIDEPEGRGKSADEVRAVNAMLRRVMADYPELAQTKLAVIYTGGRRWPGIETYDWVGFDDYNRGSAVLSNDQWDDLKRRLRPDQGILLVPGGSDPWRQDPLPFVSKALLDPQVVGIVGFIWFDDADRGVGAGIRSNPTRAAYCGAGRYLLARAASPAPCGAP